MRVSCPACGAENSLEALFGREVDARAVAGFLERHVAFGELMLRYIALFRPASRRLGIARMVGLVEELLPDIERGAINRKSRDWAAPRDNWRAALETVLAKRADGSLKLPLVSHGLLYEVLVGIADRYERRTETEREAATRNHRRAGADEGPRDLGQLLGEVIAVEPAAVLLVPAAAMPPSYQRPSRAAMETRAQIEAYQRARSGEPAPDNGAAT